ncbi:DNA polymerase IV [Streptomyces sp. NPDC000229]|uniref:DNA polymerase IV n=1 Tax=Streptomyces sp. NPDC000229 TaxID=3154247 RepID=UPI003328066C
MRASPTILHLDMDAFFAAAEQAAKPSLRGKPVVVGGLGPRGVVATASYEARRFGVHSAMPMAQARRLAPNAAYLVPRFSLYRAVSEQVMRLLRELSPLVEPLSLDEAFVDLEAGGSAHDAAGARAAGERLRSDIRAVTGLTGSVGLAGSKMLAKIASEEAKPDGLVLIEPGTERELLGPKSVRILPGVGPATGEHLRRAGMSTVADLAAAGEDELVRLLGKAHGESLHRMAMGYDDRPVVAERDAKSVSVEDTFDVDLHDRVRVRWEVERLAERCVQRLRGAGRSGRTVVLKVRRYDFSTLTRSETLRGPTDDPVVVREAAARLLEGVDTTGGVRLLGVGVTGLADYTQEDLFAQAAAERAEGEASASERVEAVGAVGAVAADPAGTTRGAGSVGVGDAADRGGAGGSVPGESGALGGQGVPVGSPAVDARAWAGGPAGAPSRPGGGAAEPAAGESAGRPVAASPGGRGHAGLRPDGGQPGAGGDARADGPRGVDVAAGGGVGEPMEPDAREGASSEGEGRRGGRAGGKTGAGAGEAGAAAGPAGAGGGGGPVGHGSREAVVRERAAAGPGSAGPSDAGGAGGAGVPGTGGSGGPGGAGMPGPGGAEPGGAGEPRRWVAGEDVRHAEYGAGWVQGSGLGRVTVRFEEPGSPPGRVRTFWADDPDLEPSDPLPLVPGQSSWPASLPKSRSVEGGGGSARP